MKILSSVLNCIFSFTVFYSLIFNYKTTVLAWDNTSTQTQFQQSILPVRFIYVDENKDIVRIFNNVADGNTLFIMKFFNSQDDQEIEITPALLTKYQVFINNVDISTVGFSYTTATPQNVTQDGRFEIELINSPQGLQEIHTII